MSGRRDRSWEPHPEVVEHVSRKWVELAPLIDRLLERSGDRDDFPVLPRSALAGDDRASSPYQVSHAVRACLTAAIDHLHAVKTLVYDSGVLHLAAPATLARAVIENAATGLWIITPASRNHRIQRALKWHVRNAHDLVGSGFAPPGRTKEHYLDRIVKVAEHRNIEPSTVRSGYQVSTAIKAVGDAHPDLRPMQAWQICSGFAHGRPWAYLGALPQTALGSSEPGVADVRLTNDPTLTMYPILTGVHVIERLLQTHATRAGFIP